MMKYVYVLHYYVPILKIMVARIIFIFVWMEIYKDRNARLKDLEYPHIWFGYFISFGVA